MTEAPSNLMVILGLSKDLYEHARLNGSFRRGPEASSKRVST
jgi:hypothetical protein